MIAIAPSNRKTVLTCAITGNAPFNRRHPTFPITPEDIARDCVESSRAGAAVVHIHVRDPLTGNGSRSPRLFKEVVDRVRDSNVDVLINLTGGLGAFFLPDPADEGRALPQSDIAGVDERLEHLRLCKPDLASLDITTGNQLEGEREFVYLNTTRTLREMAKGYRELDIKPELEVFGPGDILFGVQLAIEGLLSGVPLYQFVLGVKWAAPADTSTIQYMRGLLPSSAVWGALGIGRMQMPIVAQSFLVGGNVRVGLEDNLYLRRGIFATNAELVIQARLLVEAMGGELASADEARTIMDLHSAPGRSESARIGPRGK